MDVWQESPNLGTLPPTMNRRSPAEFRNAIRKVRRLYSTPEVLSNALRLMQQPDVNLESIENVVRNDSALVADLIRLSNSALFSRGSGSADLQIALQRLGLREVIRAIELSMSKHIFGKGLASYGVTPIQYWRTSILGALLMERLAFMNGTDGPEAYTVGILHALGRVLINVALEEVGTSTPWDRSTSLENWEVSQVGFTSAEAGALLLREWSFPQAAISPIENQLGTPAAVAAGTPVGMLRLVRLLIQADPETGMATQPPVFPPDLLGWAGFANETEVQDLLADAQRQLATIADGLGMSSN